MSARRPLLPPGTAADEGHRPGTAATGGWSWRSSPRGSRPSPCSTAPRRSCPSWRAFDVSRRGDPDRLADDRSPRARPAGRRPAFRRVGRTTFIHLSLPAPPSARRAARSPPPGRPCWCCAAQGVALAGLPAVATAYLREELHPSTHARAAGLYIGGTALGGMIGRLLTGAVAEAAGWRWALAATACSAWRAPSSYASCCLRHDASSPVADRPPHDAHHEPSRRCRPRPPGLYAVGGLLRRGAGRVFNTLGFRLEAAPFGLGLAAASLVFLVYPLGTVASAPSAGSPTPWPGAVLPLGACWPSRARCSPCLVAARRRRRAGAADRGFFAVHGVASGWVPARAHAGGVGTGQAASLYLSPTTWAPRSSAAWRPAWPAALAGGRAADRPAPARSPGRSRCGCAPPGRCWPERSSVRIPAGTRRTASSTPGRGCASSSPR